MTAFICRRIASYCFAAALTVGMVGCEDEAPSPGEQLDSALEKGEDAMEQGNQAIDDMKQQGRDAKQNVEELSAQAKDLAQQQIDLMKERLSGFGEKIKALPAEQEQAFSARLAALRTQADEAEATLKGYAGQAGAAWEPVKEKLDAVKSKFDAFAEEMDEAKP